MTKRRDNIAPDQNTDIKQKPAAFCIAGADGCKLWGLTPAERLRRGLRQTGISQEISPKEIEQFQDAIIIARADAVIDAPLLSMLAETKGLMLTGSDGSEHQRLCVHAPKGHAKQGLKLLMGAGPIPKKSPIKPTPPDKLDASYWVSLRKREIPYAMAITRQNQPQVEWRTFMATYKGATDFVTKHIWPRPAFYITRFIAPLKITPNMVTALSAICVVLAYVLFAQGAWGLGLVAAWLMALLDTVDGKLARVTLTSSKWGNVFDHGIDLIHPPFWYLAWGFGLAASGYAFDPILFNWLIFSIFAGYIAQRLIEGIAIKFLSLEIHVWRKIDTQFRSITARRNPNMAILTISAILSAPDWGLIAVALWTLICLLVHIVQIIQAHKAYRAHGRLPSWLEKPELSA